MALGLAAVVLLVIGAVSTIGRIPAVSELYAQTSWRGSSRPIASSASRRRPSASGRARRGSA